jgi:hypothetical protein
VFFEYATLRVVAIPRGEGYRFLLLAGDGTPAGIENELLQY